MSLMVASNVHISTTLFLPLSKVLNDSKSYVPAVPIIMSFKVLKEFPISKISLFKLVPTFYEKNIFSNKHKGNKAKTKSMKPKLLETLPVSTLISFIGT